MKLPIIRSQIYYTQIGQILGMCQPEVARVLVQVYRVSYAEELTPLQQELDRLMRQPPRPGRDAR